MITNFDGVAYKMSKHWVNNLDVYIDGVMNKNTSAVFLFDGRSGMGKTTLSFQTSGYIANGVAEIKSKEQGKEVKPKFGLDDVCWTPDEFIEKLKNAERGDIVILDESMILSNRSSMSEMNKAIIIMMSMIRSKQIFVIFNANSIFDLDKNLPLHRADVLLHLYAQDDRFATRGNYMIFPSAHGILKRLYITGKKFYDYSGASAVIRDNFPNKFLLDEKEYDKRKTESINTYFEKDNVTGTKTKHSRDNLVRYIKNELLIDNQTLANITGVSLRTIQRILKEY